MHQCLFPLTKVMSNTKGKVYIKIFLFFEIRVAQQCSFRYNTKMIIKNKVPIAFARKTKTITNVSIQNINWKISERCNASFWNNLFICFKLFVFFAIISAIHQNFCYSSNQILLFYIEAKLILLDFWNGIVNTKRHIYLRWLKSKIVILISYESRLYSNSKSLIIRN